jgi:hypothetical protein
MGDFNRATRAARLQLPTASFVDSGISLIDVPQVGYLGAISLLLSGSNASITGTQVTYPLQPFSLIRRIRLVTNEGAEIWNTSGWGAYLYNATLRTGLDYATNHSDYFGPGTDPFVRYYKATGNLSSATGTFKCFWHLPVSWGPMNLTGLLLLQNPGVKFQIEITWGTNSDMWTSITGTPAIAATITPQVDLYHLPADQHDDPDLMFAKTVIEDQKTISGTGDFVYNPILGNTLNKVIQEFVQGPAGSYAPFNCTDFTSTKVTFAQSQVVYNINTDNHLADMRRWYGRDLPSGVLVHDWTIGNGMPEIPNGRDTFDTSQITDFSITTTIPSTTTVQSGSFCRTVREQLVQIRG